MASVVISRKRVWEGTDPCQTPPGLASPQYKATRSNPDSQPMDEDTFVSKRARITHSDDVSGIIGRTSDSIPTEIHCQGKEGHRGLGQQRKRFRYEDQDHEREIDETAEYGASMGFNRGEELRGAWYGIGDGKGSFDAGDHKPRALETGTGNDGSEKEIEFLLGLLPRKTQKRLIKARNYAKSGRFSSSSPSAHSFSNFAENVGENTRNSVVNHSFSPKNGDPNGVYMTIPELLVLVRASKRATEERLTEEFSQILEQRLSEQQRQFSLYVDDCLSRRLQSHTHSIETEGDMPYIY